VAAISEDLPRLAAPGRNGAVEGGGRPEKVLMRAALTVRRKQKEDLKEALAGHLDALWDMVGWSIALELISTKIHPSKHRAPFPPCLLLVQFTTSFPIGTTIRPS
jgi:lipoxygenase